MTVHLITHETSLQHRTPVGHPERAERVTAVTDAVTASSHDVAQVDAPQVDIGLLETIHDRAYIERIKAFCIGGGGALDPDTHVVPESWQAALHAAGAGPHAVDLLRKRSGTAFVAMRPPGHHAERHQAMGFCLFNNIAVTAAYLMSMGERVAVVDWDVHHGNGTQHSFYSREELLYVSLHEFPFYPGTGWVDEVGEGKAKGMTVNIPLPGGTTAPSYLAAFDRLAMPVVAEFQPDWILVSSGFDAHIRDPLGGLSLESLHYGWMAKALLSVVPGDRIIAFLEGGYDLVALREASVATLDGLTGEIADPVWPTDVHGSAKPVVDLASDAIERHWKIR
jgi:acetoin utilization deacetylase AcuC-like enzyme